MSYVSGELRAWVYLHLCVKLMIGCQGVFGMVVLVSVKWRCSILDAMFFSGQNSLTALHSTHSFEAE